MENHDFIQRTQFIVPLCWEELPFLCGVHSGCLRQRQEQGVTWAKDAVPFAPKESVVCSRLFSFAICLSLLWKCVPKVSQKTIWPKSGSSQNLAWHRPKTTTPDTIYRAFHRNSKTITHPMQKSGKILNSLTINNRISFCKSQMLWISALSEYTWAYFLLIDQGREEGIFHQIQKLGIGSKKIFEAQKLLRFQILFIHEWYQAREKRI